jgi:hypothetical protein
MKINTALCLLGITMFSGTVYANNNYGFCIASFYDKGDRQVTNTFFVEDPLNTYKIDPVFASYIRQKEGSVDGAFCRFDKTKQGIEEQRNKAIQQNRELGRVVEIINWSFNGK